MNIFKETREAYKKARAEKRAAQLRSKTPQPDELQQEYWKLAAQAGEKNFQIDCLEAEIRQLNERMLALSQLFPKAQAVHKKADGIAPKAAPPPDAQKAIDAIKAAAVEPVSNGNSDASV